MRMLSITCYADQSTLRKAHTVAGWTSGDIDVDIKANVNVAGPVEKGMAGKGVEGGGMNSSLCIKAVKKTN